MPPHEGLVHLKVDDWRDSNVEFIGSEIDHKVKYNSAATEPAWQGMGERPGSISGGLNNSSYIILHSYKVGSKDGEEKLGHDIFFWLGSKSTQDEAGTAAYKTVELDEYLHGTATQHRELQTEPSDDFVALFSRIRILSGGVRSGFTHVETEQEPKETLMLLRVFKHPSAKRADSIMVYEVEPTWQSLDESDVFVLERNDKIWVWQGKNCSPMEKAKAAQVVHDMTVAKHIDVEVLSQSESRSRTVVNLLGGEDAEGPFKAVRPIVSRESQRPHKLWRLSDASGTLELDVVKEGHGMTKSDLDSNDVFLLDTGNRIWVWQGSGASRAEKDLWIKVAEAYARHVSDTAENGDTRLSPIAKVVDGHESITFVKAARDLRHLSLFPSLPCVEFDNSNESRPLADTPETMDLNEAQAYVQASLHDLFKAFQRVPGSAVLIRYIQSSYQDDPIRSAIELVLVIFFVRYLLSPSYPTHGSNYIKLREDEIDELVKEWEPEPLVAEQSAFEENEAERVPVVIGTVINLASYNFYNFNSNESIKEKAVQTLRTYGVGPCGPPQFYGTQDVHMQTEADIASFLGTQSAIVYAHAFSTITSVLPSFCKRGDVIVADRMVNYSIRKGLEASRSTIRWYSHNDMADLERVMAKVAEEQSKRKALTRRFIVTEGLFEMVGDCSDLPKLIELKEKYKFRLALDETNSFGVLGRNGRGLTEAQNVDAESVDVIVGSLTGPLCAAGGFCAGSTDVVRHQRINALAYTYSAALPAMSAVTASETLNVLQCNPDILIQCRENIRAMRAQLDPRSDWVICTSDPENPVMLLVFKPDVIQSRRLSIEDQERLFSDCAEESLVNGVLITRLKTMPLISSLGPKDTDVNIRPALKVCITSGLSKKEIEKAGVTIRHAITKVMTRKTNRLSGSTS
ncbi:hypothetical protein E0Z10_g9453 [Xylaria hypoxylon]|uniref:serine C-palmitoyltransferase n=1 Tax=Xylaria hypoxylon TaxID=37992 RepID=A0A4Z0YJ24_9PEZI|nr:hypothetical protein E0Z10_g9453 [Xylaria hypoxylon]